MNFILNNNIKLIGYKNCKIFFFGNKSNLNLHVRFFFHFKNFENKSSESKKKLYIERLRIKDHNIINKVHTKSSEMSFVDTKMKETSISSEMEREILPKNVKVIHYDLKMEPHFNDFTFTGEVTIDFKVLEKSTFITLNVLEIEINKAEMEGYVIKDIVEDSEKQRITFNLNKDLVVGKIEKIYLKFKGCLNDKMAGFYRSSYVENDTTKYLATTQFEPIDCRRAFPCFDEPAEKAKFTIHIVCDADLVALSNMDVKNTKMLSNNKKEVSFNTTPVMSTYLIAFIVGDLKYVENNDYSKPIRVYATPGSEHLGVYACEIAAKTLKFFEEKFDIPYPLPKCDMVAIHDFSSGAMENFGLITYRTIDLLLDPKKCNINTNKRVTSVVTHELAHQWFGNLVTMDFWDGLWLNEGFATWMSWYVCDHLFPDWKVWEFYVSDTLQHALSLDSLRSSHPVEVPIKKADEISQIFDAISYSKGSSLLKMISRWLGEEVFIKGVSNYLKKHKWGNTKTSDLWKSLSDISNKDVMNVMNKWTKNTGFPVVHVKEKLNELTLTQSRFLSTGDVKPEENQIDYPIFLGLKTTDKFDESLVLFEKTKKIKLNIKDDFFKLNGDHSGIYRVAYEPSRWEKLGKHGVQGKLTIEDRVGLVADAGSLASSGYIETTCFLNLVKSWSNETNYVLILEILCRISSIRNALIFEKDDFNASINSFIIDLLENRVNSVGWSFNDDDLFADQQLKTLLFGAFSGSDQENAVDYAHNTFTMYVNGDKNAIHPNLKPYIFNVVAKYGSTETFEQLYKIYMNPVSAEEKLSALRAFGAFRDEKILEKVLDMLTKSDIIKQQDIYIPMQNIRTHAVGIERLWKWLKDNWDEIYELLPPGLSMLGSVVTFCTSGFTKLEQKQDVIEFFKDKNILGFDQSLAQSLDVITTKINWANRDSENIKNWLIDNGYYQV